MCLALNREGCVHERVRVQLHRPELPLHHRIVTDHGDGLARSPHDDTALSTKAQSRPSSDRHDLTFKNRPDLCCAGSRRCFVLATAAQADAALQHTSRRCILHTTLGDDAPVFA